MLNKNTLQKECKMGLQKRTQNRSEVFSQLHWFNVVMNFLIRRNCRLISGLMISISYFFTVMVYDKMYI